MKNILEITDKNLDHYTIPFLVTSHFLEKVESRNLIRCRNIDEWIRKSISGSIIVVSRSINIINLINRYFHNTLYLYNKNQKVVFVLEEDRSTYEYRILRTSYSALESKWMERWLSDTQKSKRKKFIDDYQGYDIALSYTPNSIQMKDELNKKLSNMEWNFPNKEKIIVQEELQREAAKILANNKVVNEITTRLKEENPKAIKAISIILDKIGHDKILDIFNETLKIESQGGMLLKNGSGKRKTPGGA